MKKIIIKKDSESARFIAKVMEDKKRIREQIKSGKKLSDLEGKMNRFVQPL